ALSSGHLALASCTRFSPKTAWPAAVTGSIASAATVFDIATSVTEAGSRPAARQAASISLRTAANLGHWPTSRLVTVSGSKCNLANFSDPAKGRVIPVGHGLMGIII